MPTTCVAFVPIRLCVVRRADRVEDQTALLEAQPVRQAKQRPLGHPRVLGMHAVQAEAVPATGVAAVGEVARPAHVAHAARVAAGSAHAVAHLQHAGGVHRHDDPGALVPGDEGLLARLLVQGVQVGPADGRRLELHHHLLPAGLGIAVVPRLHLAGVHDSRTAHVLGPPQGRAGSAVGDTAGKPAR